MGCCTACDEGHGCSGEKSPAALPSDLIIPGPEPDMTALISMQDEAETDEQDLSAPWSGRALRAGAPVPVNTRLKLANAETNASDALSLAGCSSGSVDLVLFVLSQLTSVEAILEGTVDGENFTRISSTIFSAEGFARFRFRNAAFRLIRIYYTATGSPGGIGVVATTIYGSRN